jgi:hypothetical protein
MHIVRPEMYLLCFHITIEQSSQDAYPVPPTHTISSQRKSFHSKPCTLPESTSLISIRCSENTSVPVLSALSFSLSRILLQQSLGQVLGAAESSSLAPSFPAAEHLLTLFFLDLLPLPLHALLPPTMFYYILLCSDLSKIILLIFFHATQNLHWLPPEAF